MNAIETFILGLIFEAAQLTPEYYGKRADLFCVAAALAARP